MQPRTCVFAALVCAAGLSAQTSSAPVSAEEAGRAYVRRFSLGASLSITPMPLIPNNAVTVSTTVPAIQGLYQTTAKSQWFGYGVTTQVAVTARFAVSASLLVRRPGFIFETETLEGILIPNQPDTRRHTISRTDTHARYYDLPVLVRFYNKDRYSPGPRVFFEGGAALRRVTNIRSSTTISINGATPTCCDLTPMSPTHRQIRGVVAGFGAQVIDPIGIRVVPEVRYTRWSGDTINNQSTAGQKNQIEALVSLTF